MVLPSAVYTVPEGGGLPRAVFLPVSAPRTGGPAPVVSGVIKGTPHVDCRLPLVLGRQLESNTVLGSVFLPVASGIFLVTFF